MWTRVCAANPEALCVAVDYGHCLADRPVGGSLSSYREARQTPVTYDGRHDITAHVAFDSLASCVGGDVRRQRDVLQELGINGTPAQRVEPTTDPAGYLEALATATTAAELIEIGGLGDFCWLSGPLH